MEAQRVMRVLRFARDTQPELWDRLMRTEAGIGIMNLWDEGQAEEREPANLPMVREVCNNMRHWPAAPGRDGRPAVWTPA